MNKFVGVALGGLVAGVLVGLLLSGGGVFGASSGTYHTNDEQFAGAVTFSGAVTQTGTVSHTGANTFTGAVTVSGGSASTTLALSGKGGCIAIPMEGTTTLAYWTATSTSNTVLVSTTKPATCK